MTNIPLWVHMCVCVSIYNTYIHFLYLLACWWMLTLLPYLDFVSEKSDMRLSGLMCEKSTKVLDRIWRGDTRGTEGRQEGPPGPCADLVGSWLKDQGKQWSTWVQVEPHGGWSLASLFLLCPLIFWKLKPWLIFKWMLMALF